jgi:hypothetical protein
MHEMVFGRLKETVFSKAKPVASPVAIIAGARPGSGKTRPSVFIILLQPR